MVSATAVYNTSQKEREKLFETWYEQAFPVVAGFVGKMGGALDDAKDIFHDAMVIYYEKYYQEKDFTVRVSEEAYILGIAKHLWVRKFKKDRHKIALDDLGKDISIPEDYFTSPENNRLLQILELTGKRCLEILHAFYYEKLSMSRIVQTLGYANTHSATVQKYKCLEKVRDKIKEKSIRYDDFME